MKNVKKIGTCLLAGSLLTFVGCSIGGTGSSSTVYYTVKFVQEGYTDIEYTVKAGEALTTIPTPQPVVGYTVKWEADLDNITQDMTIEAVATPNDYSITYQLATEDGETMEGELTQTVTYDAEYTLATPEKANCNFLGWSSGTTVLPQTGIWKIADDVTLSAAWAEAYYTIVFAQTDGSTVTRLVEIGETLAESDIPEPISEDGYEVAWSVEDFSTITETTTVTVVKTAKKYSVTYNLDEGETMEDSSSDTFAYNSAYTLKEPTKEGYTFQNWKTADGVAVPLTGTWKYLSNLELTAEWTADNNTITFIYANGDKVERTLQTGSALTDIPTLNSVEGYDVAWSITDFSTVTGATTVTEVRTPKTYVITFKVPEDTNLNGTTQNVVYNSEYTLPTPNYAGYAFIAWEHNGTFVPANGEWKIASDVELQASWLCTVTFVRQDLTTEVRTVKMGDALTDIPTCNAKKGYAVDWSVKDFSKIESNMTVVEEATANKYTIKFNSNGGSAMSDKTVTYDGEYTLETPTRSGYQFDGWLDESGKKVELTGTWMTDSNVTLTAKWTAQQANDGWTGNS